MPKTTTYLALVAALALGVWSPPALADDDDDDHDNHGQPNPIDVCINGGGDILTCLCLNGGPCEGAMFTLACAPKDCPRIDPNDFDIHNPWPDAIADFYDSKGNLLYTDSGIFMLQPHINAQSGEVRFMATGNLSRIEFDANYRDPKTTLLDRTDLQIRLRKVDAKGRVLAQITGWNVAYSRALWCEHSGDSAGLQQDIDDLEARFKAHEILNIQQFAAEAAARKQGDVDTLAAAVAYTDAVRVMVEAQIQAEAVARAAADALITAALNAEIAARKAGDMLLDAQIQAEAAARIAGDAALQLAIAAEVAARKQGDIDTLAAANAYTDAQIAALPWPRTCPKAGDVMVWDGARWICEAATSCPSDDPNTQYLLVADNNVPNHIHFACRAYCGGLLVDPQNDKNNCGACGNFCFNTFEVNDTNCQAGSCAVSACNNGFLDCNGVYADGCECSVPNGTPKCGMGGACAIDTCNAGFGNCNGIDVDGCEIDLNADNNNCGACGNVCPMGQQCGGGVCQAFFNWQGVILNTPKQQFTGWMVCFEQPYGTFGPSLGQIMAQCPQPKIAYTCSANGSPDYQVAAWAPRGDVFMVTPDCSNQTHIANGAYWYFNNSCSMGFSPIPTISQNSADTQDAPGFANNFNSGDLRISWHTGGGQINGGWRCGNTTFLNSEPSGFTRYILQSP